MGDWVLEDSMALVIVEMGLRVRTRRAGELKMLYERIS